MMKLVFLAFLAMAVAIGEAATITVGGTTGWTVPSTTDFYDNWENNQSIVVGDTLVFPFAQGAHDVARVTESAYDSCDPTSPIFTELNSPFSFVVNDTSDYYFICTFSTHCSRGQKLAITDVKSSNTTTPSSTPPPSTTNGPSSSATPSPPPPPSSNSVEALTSAITVVVVPVVAAIGAVIAFLT